jgi:hypothetical protein
VTRIRTASHYSPRVLGELQNPAEIARGKEWIEETDSDAARSFENASRITADLAPPLLLAVPN